MKGLGLKRRNVPDSPSKEDAMALLNIAMSPKRSKEGRSPRKKFRGPFSTSPKVPIIESNKHMTSPPPKYIGALNSLFMMNNKNNIMTLPSQPSVLVGSPPIPLTVSTSPRRCDNKRQSPSTDPVWMQIQQSPTHLKSSVTQITKDDVNRVKKLIREKVKPANSKIIENRGCHICHTRAAKVVMCCAKGYVSHSFCATHVQKQWGHKIPDLEKDPSIWRVCPVCSLECPCSACQRKLRKTVKELCTGQCEDDSMASIGIPRARGRGRRRKTVSQTVLEGATTGMMNLFVCLCVCVVSLALSHTHSLRKKKTSSPYSTSHYRYDPQSIVKKNDLQIHSRINRFY